MCTVHSTRFVPLTVFYLHPLCAGDTATDPMGPVPHSQMLGLDNELDRSLGPDLCLLDHDKCLQGAPCCSKCRVVLTHESYSDPVRLRVLLVSALAQQGGVTRPNHTGRLGAESLSFTATAHRREGDVGKTVARPLRRGGMKNPGSFKWEGERRGEEQGEGEPLPSPHSDSCQPLVGEGGA